MGTISADNIFIVGDKPHQYFKRDADNNPLYTAKVGLKDALVGCLLQIPTIERRVLTVQLNEIIQRVPYTFSVTREWAFLLCVKRE